MTTPRTDDTVPHLEWAQTQTLPYAAPADPAPVASQPTEAASAASDPALTGTTVVDPVPHTAPALNPPTWSGRKTAVAAALAIGFSSMGAVAAAAALPAGTTQGGGQVQRGGLGPGGGPRGGFPGQGTQQGTQQGGTGQLPGQLPGQPQQAPAAPGAGQQQSPADPNASTT